MAFQVFPIHAKSQHMQSLIITLIGKFTIHIQIPSFQLTLSTYFHSIHHEKKRHSGRKNLIKPKAPKDNTFDEILIFQSDHYFESKSQKNDDDDDEKVNETYKLFYVELIKIFVSEIIDKNTLADNADLASNIFSAANEYIKLNNDLYEVIPDISNIT